jgi:hypothetical protein
VSIWRLISSTAPSDANCPTTEKRGDQHPGSDEDPVVRAAGNQLGERVEADGELLDHVQQLVDLEVVNRWFTVGSPSWRSCRSRSSKTSWHR